MKKFLFLIASVLMLSTLGFSQKAYKPIWESIDSCRVPEWFEDAKIGSFIHWGLYSVPVYSRKKRDKVDIYDQYNKWYWNRWVIHSKQTYTMKSFN